MAETEREVTFQSGDRTLAGRLYTPDKSNDRMRLAVVSHSFRFDMTSPLTTDIYNSLKLQGYSILMFDFTGHGKSTGGLENVSFASIKQDEESAINHLKKTVDSTGLGRHKLALIGASMGTIGAVLSSIAPNAMILVSPAIDERELYNRYLSGIENGAEQLAQLGYVVLESTSGRGSFKMGRLWIDEVLKGNIHLAQKYEAINTSKVPTLLIYGSEDNETIRSEIQRVVAKNKGLRQECIKGANHDFTDSMNRATLTEVMTRTLNFFI